ncbi:MAG TPA: copper chaperone [Nitrospirae bacterium]|nr:copper chaperone [Nitrospirota bacterium]
MAVKTINIDGMSCGHCIQWLNKALTGVDGVSDAKVSLEAQNAVVDYDESKVTEGAMTAAIEKAGYSVKSFA